MRRLVRHALAAFAAALAAAPAAAATSDWAEAPVGRARLVTVENGVGPEAGRLSAGLQIELRDGWKTYWRSPGEVGLPPTIDWSASSNLERAEIAWPAPERFTAFGIENYGYSREVVLPIALDLERPGATTRLRASVSALVCREICVPAAFDLGLDLAGRGAAPDAEAAALLAEWTARVPDDGRGSGLALTGAGAEADAEAGAEAEAEAVTVAATAAGGFAAPDVFLEGPPGATFGKPEIRVEGGRLWARTPVTGGELPPEAPLRVTVVDGARAASFETTLGDAPPPAPRTGGASLAWALGAALLGGLILNAMPCVLPVLSLKLHAAVAARGAPRGRLRASFLATAAGVVASMWALAAGVALAREAGVAVGWGLQFQSPLFLAFMAAVTTLFAANLAGLFEIGLPSGLATRAASAGGRDVGSLGGAFGAGAFATLLATPCSAPFVGTAVAFALSGEAWRIGAIFTALGIGLASPYLLVAAAPGLARLLPRPGRWMARLRLVLAALLLGTALWLLSVLAASASLAAALVAGGLLAAAMALLALGPRLARGGVAALVAAALLAPALIGREPAAPAAAAAAEEAVWRPFDRAAIPALVAEGRTVFVDVTADWCLTCRANKALALDRAEVAARLAAEDVVAMRADWTRPDPAIAEYLASHGRYGIPFNVAYGPAAPEGVVLSELLTPAAVLGALDAAAGADVALR